MRTKLTIAVIFLGLLLFLRACASSSPTTVAPTDTLAPGGYTYIDYTSSNTTVPELGKLRLDKAIWGPYSIYFFGSTSLPEGIRLKTQLYKDKQAVGWWPEYLHVRLADGTWELSVKARESEAPEELPGFERGYSLWIWNVDFPAITAQLSLDSPGPPLETRIPGSNGAVTLELQGSRWQLSSLNDTKPLFNTKITLEFREGWATGMSDCNHYGGGYVIKAPNLINIYDCATTLLSCGERSDKQSEVYLSYLHDAICYRIVDEHLEMYDVITNNRTLVFERQP